ncbi:MAG: hypothetical protein VKP57_02015 [Candidatus Sericytochromatia bacterium]|nr:hypothetical protein [Candidatus Sericytochromatia bacterium]
MPDLQIRNVPRSPWPASATPGVLDQLAGHAYVPGKDQYLAAPRRTGGAAEWATAGFVGAMAGGSLGTLAGAALKSPKLVGIGIAAGTLSGVALYPGLRDSMLGRNPRAAIVGGWLGAGALAIGALQLGVVAGPAIAAAGAVGAVAGALGSARIADR